MAESAIRMSVEALPGGDQAQALAEARKPRDDGVGHERIVTEGIQTPMRATKIRVSILLTIACLLLLPAGALGEEARVKVGVLAKRGPKRCMKKWCPTADYLTAHIPEYSFIIVPLTFEEVHPAVERGAVDFVLTNPSFYVELEAYYGVNRIATLRNLRLGHAYTSFGGVVFCRAARQDIRCFADLKGKSFMAVQESSFGGWRMPWRELKDQGIDPYRDFARLEFGGTHDAVVRAVRDGEVDAGTVRTDTLERMAMEGSVSLQEFYIVNQRKSEGFPFAHSTRLYPEWPFAKVRRTSDDLAQQVAIALLAMPADSPAARVARCAGWTVPLNYQSVHDCLKELRVGPYKDFGKVTFTDVLRTYWYWLVLGAVVMSFMVASTIYVLRLNRKLNLSKLELQQARDSLELRVNERTTALQAEITERKRAEEELSRHREHLEELVEERTAELAVAKERAESADRLKSAFLATMSHELRTPLNSIIGFTGVILQGMVGPLNAEQHKELGMVYDSAKHLLALINDILDLSKIEAGEVEIFPEEFDVPGLIDRVVKTVSPLAEQKGLEVAASLSPEVGRIYSDRRRVEQILLNLANNAIKFTEKGCVRIEGIVIEEYLQLSVQDTGIGIKPEDMDKLFQTFRQIQTVSTREHEGTGLGLAICKKLVTMLGGEVWAESEYGVGSKFTFTLPLQEG